MKAVIRGLRLLVPIAVVAVAGCQAFPRSRFPEEYSMPPMTMVLMAGDEVEISFLGAPDLNTTQVLRRDGAITLKLLGDVQAAGKTPKELRNELMQKYASQLQVKEVTVVLRTPAPVFVSGAVLKAGSIPMGHPMTALEAIMQAGGFNETEAEVRNVIVIRHDGSKYRGYSINFKPLLRKGAPEPIFYLQPFDIVYVPRTLIVKVNQWVSQYINKNIPVLGMSYNPSSGEFVYYR